MIDLADIPALFIVWHASQIVEPVRLSRVPRVPCNVPLHEYCRKPHHGQVAAVTATAGRCPQFSKRDAAEEGVALQKMGGWPRGKRISLQYRVAGVCETLSMGCAWPLTFMALYRYVIWCCTTSSADRLNWRDISSTNLYSMFCRATSNSECNVGEQGCPNRAAIHAVTRPQEGHLLNKNLPRQSSPVVQPNLPSPLCGSWDLPASWTKVSPGLVKRARWDIRQASQGRQSRTEMPISMENLG